MADPKALASAFPATSVSRQRLRQTTALTAVAFLAAAPALAGDPLPTGGAVVQGTASIATPGTGSMVITQTSDRAVVNWQGFSIGEGAQVAINQPGTGSAILNRVTGSAGTDISGRLTATGQVFIVNPNGVFIGPDGSVSTGGGFVASTLDIADDDFAAGRLRFAGDGSSAKVTNAGTIAVGRGGYAALIGGRVENAGTVSVPLGRIGFGAGERVTLDVSGDQFLQVAVPSADDGDGAALIINSGDVRAEGGLIAMSAATARDAARHAINMSGVAEATSVSVRDGAIILGGGAGGAVTVSGRMSVAAVDASPRPPERPARGGAITITGAEITLAGALVDASGVSGGGVVRVGGDFAGAGDLAHAAQVSMDALSHIDVDAKDHGDGGRVVLWSDVGTDFAGTISSRGGPNGGNGGFVEVSSAHRLSYSGLVDLRAPEGEFGTVLLDPANIIVPSLDFPEATIEAQLALGNVTLDTSYTELSEPGDITVNVAIDWTAATQLELIADRDIFLNAAINGTNGTLRLDALGNITTGPGGTVDVAEFQLFRGNWSQNSATLPAFSAGNFYLGFFGEFLRVVGGDGSLANPYLLTDVFGLQGLNSPTLSASSFALANAIDASGTSGWTNPFGGSSAGFEPISSFDGTFDGRGYTISGLFEDTFNGEGYNGAGLFYSLGSNAVVSDLTMTGADLTGADAGVLAATNFGQVRNVRVEGMIESYGPQAGGLIGYNFGTVADSVADVMVDLIVDPFFSFSFSNEVGGFVGLNDGSIVRSHALGAVSGFNFDPFASIEIGGFVGYNVLGDISDSYALGDVSANSSVGSSAAVSAGGFAGIHEGPVARSFSAGSVNVGGDAITAVGGFAGEDFSSAPPTSNFWDVTSSGVATDPFATGLTTTQFQTTATFLALGQAQGWDFTTVWAPGDTGFYPVNYSTSQVVFAVPDPVTLTYGTTPTASTTGTVYGGPLDYVFPPYGDTLDTTPVFNALSFSAETVGAQTFTLATTSLNSTQGQTYRVVDLAGDATITPAPLTITANDLTKTYGTTYSFLGTEFATTGLVFADSVDSVTLDSGAVFASSPVAGNPYAITASNAAGTGLSNYTITYVDGVFTVNPAPLTITANNQVKVFGETFVFDGTEFTVSGLFDAFDSVDSAILFSYGEDAGAAVADSPFPIFIGSALGTGLDNYDITYVDGSMVVTSGVTPTPPPLTFTLPNPSDTITGGTAVLTQVANIATGETTAKVQDIATTLEVTAQSCAQSDADVTRYLSCLSDALNDFANELDELSADLPPGLENVAQIVQGARSDIDRARARAEQRLAAATTDAERAQIRADAINEARAAVGNAATEIRKAISLVRVDDPELASLQRQQITTIANAVDSVGIELSRAVGL